MIMAINPGPRTARFLPQCKDVQLCRQVYSYTYTNTYGQLFNEANRLPGRLGDGGHYRGK